MAERTTAKSKRTDPVKASPVKAAVAKTAAKAPAKAAAGGALSAENVRLKAELADALERIADFEIKQADLINRIDRVIDSLHKISQ